MRFEFTTDIRRHEIEADLVNPKRMLEAGAL
jgi:hypothetical protein